MKKLILAALCLFAPVCLAQTAQPLFQPQQHFVDNSGNPCAGCKLYSYAAGTTTPLATYPSASETSVNPNPVVLNASGSAAIWMGSSAYKFALLDTFGTTLWTVDNVLAPTPGKQSNAFLPLAGGTMSGNINLGGNSLLNVQNIGVGTSTPNWAIDVEGGQINSAGFLYNGLAPTNHILLGNGQYYVDSSTFPYGSLSGVPTFHYQNMEFAEDSLPAEPSLNFSAAFSGADDSGVRTNVDLATVDEAGSCTYCSITYDKYGRIIGAANGTDPIPAFTGTSGYQAIASGLIFEWGHSSTIPDGIPGLSVTFPFRFPHAAFSVTATDDLASGGSRIISVVSGSVNTSGFTLWSDGSGDGAWWFAVGY